MVGIYKLLKAVVHTYPAEIILLLLRALAVLSSYCSFICETIARHVEGHKSWIQDKSLFSTEVTQCLGSPSCIFSSNDDEIFSRVFTLSIPLATFTLI